ncbi:MAG TPA: ABC transporter substrate-binding protein [Stellaceae bacterium]|jgi:peptide/nickel transport system substrate-binding protein|nr:ABC transporter substrate-binding protein [Stellaceae bacterium]
MRRRVTAIAGAALLALAGMAGAGPALAQKSGGVLKIQHWDSPASMSILEEATYSVVVPAMSVMNNLVMYKQDVAQNSLKSIVPDLAESWRWSEDGKDLTFKLRHGVKWHDGKPFSAADVKCTFDLLTGKGAEKLRINPRKEWYQNVADVTTNGDDEAVVHLKRPQPALLTLLASGYSPVYPCHVPPAQMRQHPIGTGPFKFVEFKPNEYIKLTKNPDYWKPGRPYLDGIEFDIVPNRSTAILGFIAGKFDMTWPFSVTPPLVRDIKKDVPNANCVLATNNGTTNLLINRDSPPFDNPDLRKALALTIDRKSFIDIMTEGHAKIGAAMLPPPEGLWGMPDEMLRTIPGYDPDVQKNRAEARKIMEKLGYGPDKKLEVKVSTRNVPTFRDPAVILIDQLKEIYIDATLEAIETANWFPKVIRKDYKIGMNNTGSGVDDPDQQFYENYACGSARNYSGYCNPELDKKFEQQSMMSDQDQRKKLVWEIDKKLQEDGARPIIFHAVNATCMQPAVKGITIMVNSIYNGWRMEDAWLDR